MDQVAPGGQLQKVRPVHTCTSAHRSCWHLWVISPTGSWAFSACLQAPGADGEGEGAGQLGQMQPSGEMREAHRKDGSGYVRSAAGIGRTGRGGRQGVFGGCTHECMWLDGLEGQRRAEQPQARPWAGGSAG